MSNSAFAQGSGLSANWVNHIIILTVDTMVLIGAVYLVAMLIHRYEVNEVMSGSVMVAYLFAVLFTLLLFLGFTGYFWS